MPTYLRNALQLLPLAAVAAALAACSPETDAERAYLEARQAELEQRENVKLALEGGTEESTAVKLVKEAPGSDGAGTTEAWLERQLNVSRQSVLFPRWQAQRRGTGKYEVRFTCTLMGETGEITKKGYAWNADLILKLVTPARELSPEEMASFSSRRYRPRTPDTQREVPKLE